MMKSELALLLKALAFAAHKHRDQRRKDPEASPYINHPIALADVLVNEGVVAVSSTVSCSNAAHSTSKSLTPPSFTSTSASAIGWLM